MGVNPRSVQRALGRLRDLQLLVRQKGKNAENVLDPTPLVRRLEDLARTDADYLVRTKRSVT
jgi:hypothetical protein